MKDKTLKALEYAMVQLHREWERSGSASKVYELDIEELRKLYQSIEVEIHNRMEALDACEDISFKESLSASRENYILLRIATKAANEIKKAEKSDRVFGKLLLDKEEVKMYQLLKGDK